MSHEKKAGEQEREADELQQRSDRLGDDIEEVESDWKAKVDDDGVPGAQPSEDELAEKADKGSHGPATGAADVEDQKS